MLQALRPELLHLKRANFAAKSEYEIAQNYRLAQVALDKLMQPKRLDFMRLAKGYTQDHLELLHIIKHFDAALGRDSRAEGVNRKRGTSQSRASTNDSSRSSTPTSAVTIAFGFDLRQLKANQHKLTSERDHCFEKLRKIEQILQLPEHLNSPLAQSLLEIVYSPESETIPSGADSARTI